MFTVLFNGASFKKTVIILIICSFIMTSGPVGVFAGTAARDHLRKPSAMQSNARVGIENDMGMMDGGMLAREQRAVQSAITNLIGQRDYAYMTAVGAAGTASLIGIQAGKFVPGHILFQTLIKEGRAVTAENILCYNQIEGTLKAAMATNSAVILEVARSQLGYALDEKTVVAYVKEVAEKIGCNIPIIIHGDHIQYTQDSFDQNALLKKEYEAIFGPNTYNDKIDIETIPVGVLQNVQKQLKANITQERAAISGIIEKLLKAGFTSIAIDASTIFDAYGDNYVTNYYMTRGTAEEKLVAGLEQGFAFPLEWGVDFLKADPEKDAALFTEIRDQVLSDMTVRNRPQDEIDGHIKAMEQAFGSLTKEAKKAGFDPKTFIAAYDKVMEDKSRAKIAGEISEVIAATLTEKQKLMLIPGSNAEETAFQLAKIEEIVAADKSLEWLKGNVGKEIEIGHVDQKVPNPRRGNKPEAKLTHPMDVVVMVAYMVKKGLTFDVIATNNGSGHGTDYDKNSLVPVSQVGKITPYLTREFARIVAAVNAAVAQHGTSGSDMGELSFLAKNGIIKFNIATNYQQVVLNVFAALEDAGISGLLEYCAKNSDALVVGLSEQARAKMMKFAADLKAGTVNEKIAPTDSEFTKFLKATTAWGNKKGKIKVASSKEDVALLYAKEFKRAFKDMNQALKDIGQAKPKRVGILTSGGTASGHNPAIKAAFEYAKRYGIELVIVNEGWNGLIKKDLVKKSRALTRKDIEGIESKGGTILQSSRTNPFSKEGLEAGQPGIIWQNINDLKLDAVIAMGGDDTASVTYKLSEMFKDFDFGFVHLPKTMDFDMPVPTYGFDSYVEAAIPAVLSAMQDVKAHKRIFVVATFGRNAGFTASSIGASVGATLTLVPEMEVNLRQFVKDAKTFYDKNNWGLIVVSEGVKINRGTFVKAQVEKTGVDWDELTEKLDYYNLGEKTGATEFLLTADMDTVSGPIKLELGTAYAKIEPVLRQAAENYRNNYELLEAAFKISPKAKRAYEEGSKKVDAFGHPKLEDGEFIIAAVLEAGVGKVVANPEKLAYMFRSAPPSEADKRMTEQLGSEAILSIVAGTVNKMVYVEDGVIRSAPLTPKMGGKELDLEGANQDEMILANMATAGIDSNLQLDEPAVIKETYDTTVQRYRKLQTGQPFSLSYKEMKALLWTISGAKAGTEENRQVFSDISRMVKRLKPGEQDSIKRLATGGYFGRGNGPVLVNKTFKTTNVYIGAVNALIARAGGLAGALQDMWQPGVNIVAMKSLAGAKALEAAAFVEMNNKYAGIFAPYQVRRLELGKAFEVNGVKVDVLVVPEDKNIGRPRQDIFYFGPTVTPRQAALVLKTLEIDVNEVCDYGPGKEKAGEKQPERYAEYMDIFPDARIISASPINKDGIQKMLTAKGLAKSLLKEGLYAINRTVIEPLTTWIIDTLSCTSNAMIPHICFVDDTWGIKSGKSETIHAATDSNEFFPGNSGRARTELDKLRGDSIDNNIIPAGTNAAENLFKIKPELKGKFSIDAERIGTLAGSAYTMTFELERAPNNMDEIKAAFRNFALNRSGGVVQFWEGRAGLMSPLESMLIVGNAHSSILDSYLLSWDPATPNTLKIKGWYDNQGAAPAQMIWAWSQWMSEQQAFNEALAEINAPAAVKDGGKEIFTAQDRALILGDDSAVYNALKAGFGNVVSSVSGIQNAKGVVVIGANAIFDNAGSIAALQSAKDAAGVVDFIVWAKDKTAKKALEELGVGKLAAIHIGLQKALESVEEARIANDKVALINSDLDMGNIQTEFGLLDAAQFFDKAKVKNIYVGASKSVEGQKRINAMPLVIAKAFAMIFNSEKAVKLQLQNMANGYGANGLITTQDFLSIVDLTTQLSDIPLVAVSDEVAVMQMTYANTLNKI
ncbi:MAG: 6-phosphofructokinase [Candidatus Omnitrophota bacterium]